MNNGFYGNNNNGNAADNTNEGNGNGRSINTVTLIDCRIAGPANYTPAHYKPGSDKETQAQAKFSVYQNIRSKKMTFPITAWGKMADVIARGGATGKQLHLICSMHSYRGRVWFPTPDGAERQFVQLMDGQPLLIDKIDLTLEDISFGADSAKTVQAEIENGFRPAGWNNPASPDYRAWREQCAVNNATQFDETMTNWFGYARVRPVEGTLAIIVDKQNQNNNSGYRNNGGGGQQYQQQNHQQQYQRNSGAVNNGFRGGNQNNGQQYQQQRGNSQYVNGAYVGQRMQNQTQSGPYGNQQVQGGGQQYDSEVM